MMKKILLSLIRFYRKYISPTKPPSCRFQPTCSSYGLEAIERFGALKGGYMTIKRVLKCHPFHPGGFDPVPLKDEDKNRDHDQADS
jgi:hypothetical protein